MNSVLLDESVVSFEFLVSLTRFDGVVKAGGILMFFFFFVGVGRITACIRTNSTIQFISSSY